MVEGGATPLSRDRAVMARSRPLARRARALLWSLTVRPLVLAAGLVPTSCVVTSTPAFQEQEDCPPFFSSSQATPPANRMVTILTTATPFEFSGTVPLRSCALAKVYKGRVFVDGKLYGEVDVPANGESTRDAITGSVALQGSASLPGCHTIEFLASTAFVPDTVFRTPVKQDDLASLTWYVNIQPPGGPSSTVDGCLKK